MEVKDLIQGQLGITDDPTITLASTKCFNGEMQITAQGSNWDTIGGVVTAPSAFCKDLSKLIGRITGRLKVTEGPGGEKPVLRLVQDPGEEGEVAMGSVSLASDGADWKNFMVTMDDAPPTEGLHHYELVAQLDPGGLSSLYLAEIALSLVYDATKIA